MRISKTCISNGCVYLYIYIYIYISCLRFVCLRVVFFNLSAWLSTGEEPGLLGSGGGAGGAGGGGVAFFIILWILMDYDAISTLTS